MASMRGGELIARASQMSGLSERVLKTSLAVGAAATTVFLARFILSATARRLKKGEGLSVVVTGCDTGFGNILAKQLSSSGFVVFAACLTDDGVARLKALTKEPKHKTLHPFKMDVTSEEDVQNCRAMLEKECPEGLYCLVNNAGVHAGYKWELSPMELIEKDMKVNYFGVVRVTRALLPLLRKYVASLKAKPTPSLPSPRIITISSIAGIIKGSPLGSYMASKHAAEVFGVTLRQEVAEQGILCALVEPYYARTPLVTSIDQRKIDKVLSSPQEVLDAYGGAQDIRKRMSRNAFHTYVPNSELLEPEVVVDTVIDQIMLWWPKAHNLVGREAHRLAFLSSFATAWTADIFARQMENSGL